jgi:hypothetical protein
MERHNENAAELARFLTEHPKSVEVFYPGLESHTNHEIAARQMKGFGGMIGLDVGSAEAAKKFVNSVKLCTFATLARRCRDDSSANRSDDARDDLRRRKSVSGYLGWVVADLCWDRRYPRHSRGYQAGA